MRFVEPYFRFGFNDLRQTHRHASDTTAAEKRCRPHRERVCNNSKICTAIYLLPKRRFIELDSVRTCVADAIFFVDAAYHRHWRFSVTSARHKSIKVGLWAYRFNASLTCARPTWGLFNCYLIASSSLSGRNVGLAGYIISARHKKIWNGSDWL